MVWELYAHARLLEATDPKLGNEYNTFKMDKVFKLGLLCAGKLITTIALNEVAVAIPQLMFCRLQIACVEKYKC